MAITPTLPLSFSHLTSFFFLFSFFFFAWQCKWHSGNVRPGLFKKSPFCLFSPAVIPILCLIIGLVLTLLVLGNMQTLASGLPFMWRGGTLLEKERGESGAFSASPGLQVRKGRATPGNWQGQTPHEGPPSLQYYVPKKSRRRGGGPWVDTCGTRHIKKMALISQASAVMLIIMMAMVTVPSLDCLLFSFFFWGKFLQLASIFNLSS